VACPACHLRPTTLLAAGCVHAAAAAAASCSSAARSNTQHPRQVAHQAVLACKVLRSQSVSVSGVSTASIVTATATQKKRALSLNQKCRSHHAPGALQNGVGCWRVAGRPHPRRALQAPAARTQPARPRNTPSTCTQRCAALRRTAALPLVSFCRHARHTHTGKQTDRRTNRQKGRTREAGEPRRVGGA
jgi:hypothetical protein